MAKKTSKKVADVLLATVALLASIGIGGLFVSGGFQNVVILNWLPLIAHQVVGWALIVTTLLATGAKIIK